MISKSKHQLLVTYYTYLFRGACASRDKAATLAGAPPEE